MSQLGLGLGLTKGVVSRFNPLSLDPYLLFDTQSSMIGTLENPTLDLDPATPSTLDVITATRAGAATYTDADGLIQAASPDTVRVDYTQGEELTPTVFQRVGYTDFSSGWYHFNADIDVQDETLDGQPIVELTTTGGSGQLKHAITDTIEGQTYCFSFFVRLVSNNGGNTFRPFVQNSPTTSFSGLTLDENWQKVIVTFDGRVGGGYVNVGLVEIGGHTTDNVLEISQPQVEEGTTASSFVANTTGSPKFITGATYGPRVPMILVEPSATNYARFTDFSNGWNTLGAAPVTSETGGGLAGQSSVILTATANSGRFRQGLSGDVAGVTYTASIWIRRISGNGSIRFEHNSSPTGGSSSPLNITTEWSRVEAQFEGDCFAWGIQIDTSGDSVEIAMPQVEEGSVATSFIPAGGAGATRAADDLVISGSDFTDFYNQSEGTFYFEGVPQNLTDAPIYWMDTSPASQRIAVYDSFNVNAKLFIAGTSSEQSASYYLPNQLARLAISVKSNAQELSVNGGTSVTLTESSLPSPTSLHIGSRYSGSDYFNGHIKRLIYWPLHSDSL